MYLFFIQLKCYWYSYHRFKSDEAVTCLSVTPDGRHVVCGGGDGVIRVWGTYEGAEYKEIKGHEGICHSWSVRPKYILN